MFLCEYLYQQNPFFMHTLLMKSDVLLFTLAKLQYERYNRNITSLFN